MDKDEEIIHLKARVLELETALDKSLADKLNYRIIIELYDFEKKIEKYNEEVEALLRHVFWLSYYKELDLAKKNVGAGIAYQIKFAMDKGLSERDVELLDTFEQHNNVMADYCFNACIDELCKVFYYDRRSK
jgi:hypothetical protein